MRSSLRFAAAIAVALTAPAGTAVLLPTAAASGEPADRPLQIVQTTQVHLKDTLAADLPSRGEVRLLILVDHEGGLRDVLLLGSSHSNYTEAAVRALQEWEFRPAHQEGEPVWTRITVRLFFDARGRVVSVSGVDAFANMLANAFPRGFTNRLVSQSMLDAPLQPARTVRPRFPLQLLGKLEERASVVLDFYVDEEGRPRMPVAAHSAHPFLTEAAMNALDQWRFTPPTHGGQPVVVRARQEFVFSAASQSAGNFP